jgi:2-succinyl-6-hydroxy-2,4-cyclohexadiene-1-carboxylate synthase
VLVHGFTQTNSSWAELAADLARDHTVVRVDAPGHGRSSAAAVDLDRGGELLLDVGGPATYVGYSMGARFCLHAALARPAEVQGLVLISGTAGIDDDHERAVRRASDTSLADRISALGVASFVDAWLDLPLFSGLPRDRADVAGRRTNTEAGLRSSLELAGTGTQRPQWSGLAALAMPVLVVAGADDPKFVALAERMAVAIGDTATLAVVPRAGHTVHLEQPEAFLAVLRPWLDAHAL